MIGNNEISLNEATVIEAIQFYFDTVLFAPKKAPIIAGLMYSNSLFRFKVSEAAEVPKAAAKVPA
jgi:hypothetical protein